MIFTSNFQHILNEYVAAYIIIGATPVCIIAIMVLVAHGVGYRQGRASTQHRDKRGRYVR